MTSMDNFNNLYGKKLNLKNSIKFVLKDGENQKNFKNYQRILNFALKNRPHWDYSPVTKDGRPIKSLFEIWEAKSEKTKKQQKT